MNPINTNVNTINGKANAAGVDGGNIYLNQQGTQTVFIEQTDHFNRIDSTPQFTAGSMGSREPSMPPREQGM